MPNTIISPNMSMPVPVPTQDPGPDYASNLVLCLGIVDTHNHSPGSGVPVTPGGININSDLFFNSNNATLLRSARFSPQTGLLNGPSDLGCIYESGVDLYYNDGNGNQVRITQSGGVAGSPGSIAGLASPASATYVSANTTFVWQSAASTPAAMDMGPIALRKLVASSPAITLTPPSALSTNYTLTFPAVLPASNSLWTVDTSGNFGTIPRANTPGFSASSGTFATGSTSYVPVTNLTITITTTGNPVIVSLLSDGSATNPANISVSGGSFLGATVAVFRGSTLVASDDGYNTAGSSSGSWPMPGTVAIDAVAAGTYTYTIQVQVISGAALGIFRAMLCVYELR